MFYESINKYYDYIFPLNNKQVEFVRKEFPLLESNLIEVGCANGKLTNALSEYDIQGIDLESEFIETARDRYPHIEFAHMNMLDIDKIGNTFDGIICFGNTLVHLNKEKISEFLLKAYNKINNGGKILIQILYYDNILDNKITSLPLIDNDVIRFERTYLMDGEFMFNTNLLIKETGEHIVNSVELFPIRVYELQEMLERIGFRNIKVYGSFDREPLKEDSIPLIIVANKLKDI